MKYADGSYSWGFGLRAMKRYPELIPLVFAIGTAAVGASAFMGYALATKPDVRMLRHRGYPNEDVEPKECRKLFTFRQEYHAIPELEELKKDIGRFEPRSTK